MTTETQPSFIERHLLRTILLGISVLVMAIYWQTVGFSFINLDDNLYVYNNPAVLAGINWATVEWAFTQFHSANWHPLTWLSHALDAQLFGLNPGGHHATNIVLHLVNSLLAFAVFRSLTGSVVRSGFVAALFAVHPAHVESVAWVSERKDVLSTMFWLLTMLAYTAWARSGTVSEDTEPVGRDWRLYVLALALFACGLMSKPMLVTLPFVLVLCDFWPLGRIASAADLRRSVFEKLPFFALSAASSYVTILAQKSSGAVESLEFLSIGTRIMNALNSYAGYVGMLFFPKDLAVYYTYDYEMAPARLVLAGLFVAGVTAFAVWQFRSRGYLLWGWLWYLGTLVPVIGLVQVGAQAMADRYTYVPYFGLFVMLIWGVADLARRFPVDGRIPVGAGLAFVLVLTGLAYAQTTHWRNSESLYRHTLAVTKRNVIINHNLCDDLQAQNRLDEAEGFCREAISIRPRYANSHNTLGIIEIKRGRYAEAEQNFRKTLEIDPGYDLARINLVTALTFGGKPEEAELLLEATVAKLDGVIDRTAFTDPLRGVADAYARAGNFEKTADNLKRAIFTNPNRTDIRVDLARAYYELKRFDDAQREIEQALVLDPNDARGLTTYGLIYLATDRRKEAAEMFERALRVKPDLEEAKTNLLKAKGEK